MAYGDTRDDPEDARAKRGLTFSILLGAALGGLVGVTRYGPLSMGNVAMIGLGIIVVVSAHAAVIALLPARGTGTPPKP
jgi:hypothetical protein